MADQTKIAWAHATWNVATGCRRISAGCNNCYAAAFAVRFDRDGGRWDGLTNRDRVKPRWNGEIMTYPKRLGEPLRWRKPRDVFPCSMSDLGLRAFPDELLAAMFGVMAATQRHRYLIVTKRPSELAAKIARFGPDPVRHCIDAATAAGVDVGEAILFPPKWPLSNVLFGVTVENQDATRRIYELFEIEAAGYFASCEPMIGEVDLSPWLSRDGLPDHDPMDRARVLGWVIIGGESGRRARPMSLRWAERLVEQCDAAGVPVFVKQLGADYARRERLFDDKKAERLEHWPESLRRQEKPRRAE